MKEQENTNNDVASDIVKDDEKSLSNNDEKLQNDKSVKSIIKIDS